MKKQKPEIVIYQDLENKIFDRVYFYSDPNWPNTHEFHLRNKKEHYYFTGPHALKGSTEIIELKIDGFAALKSEIEEILKNIPILKVKRISSIYNKKNDFTYEKFIFNTSNNDIEIIFRVWSVEPCSNHIKFYSHHPMHDWQLIHDGIGFTKSCDNKF